MISKRTRNVAIACVISLLTADATAGQTPPAPSPSQTAVASAAAATLKKAAAETPPEALRRVARPIHFVPETTPLDRLLARMRAERLHLAAVLDEYGGVAGLVTLENVIEEIVGPIQDEFDAEKPELIDRGDGVWQVSGAMLVMDLEDELGIELTDRDEDTVAGLVLSDLGRRPRVGDRVETAGVTFELLEIQGYRIRTLRLTRPVPPAESAAD